MMWVTWIGSVAALGFALILALAVLRKEPGNERMKELSRAVQEGAIAYLKQQYKVVTIFFVVLFAILGVISWGLGLLSGFVPFAFITGGFFSALAGFIGMTVATRANARTAWGARESLNAGLRVAFSSGTVMGMTVVGLGLLDISIWWWLEEIPPIMITFGMGASAMALFARLGGGIFTKAADVGADLVGKVEAGIPEDDPRNPASIADNVGDNVGDVAGMGADLYESYVGSIIATMALGAVASLGLDSITALQAIQVPVSIATIGVLCSILGTFVVRAKGDASQAVLLGALRRGTYGSTALIAIGSFLLVILTLGSEFLGIWAAMIVGLIAGNIIGYFTEYYTSDHYKPTQLLSNEALTGPATTIIAGMSLGMLSTLIPVLTVIGATLAAFFLLGLYGIGLSAVGMLSTLGITLATDAYGPVADNAGGIAEMAKMEPHVRERTDALDSLGNTTAATGKGFAIGSAALTALALLAEYGNKIKIVRGADGHVTDVVMNINLLDPKILIGLFLGAMLPFVFSSLSMRAVGRAAGDMVNEVRRQFREKPGILEGTERPDYAGCVAISTQGAQREMVVPSLLAVIAPILTGIIFGPFTVIALLAGALTSGFVLAIMMANAGGAWDNAKKFIEGGAHGGKGSDAHKAAVVGDTVGDPFKDTSGPSINILLKLMSMVSIVFVTTVIALNDLFIRIFS
ncbi:Putative K(+)-stimulated pyrophosphate-energized sodium pump [Geodia barretti]|uniref:H(+)-exporting diphosphatase n=3 Tax=Geodia barretti TaxID=519541 RepID=A0AA35W974_GEOBA|nr:Putative K(+)-stimulated pyrophosphate-energized sodium pump [Geodia barretti]